MNDNIARFIHNKLHSSNPEADLKALGVEIVNAHNVACTFGFLNLPQLQFDDIEVNVNCVSLYVLPKAGMINLDDLCNIKSVWGADDLNINTEYIEIVFFNA